MNLNTCNFIKRIEQVLAELDISAIEEYVIFIIINIILQEKQKQSKTHTNAIISFYRRSKNNLKPIRMP